MISPDQINTLFERFASLRVLVIGDVMIDSYLWGKVERISPEAPVPIVAVNKRTNRLGGAANVALNIKALGATPVLCSVIGNDDKGETFISLMKENGLDTTGIIRSTSRITTTKFRVIGNNMQMLRVDEETDSPLIAEDFGLFASNLETILSAGSSDVIIFQDYDKGVITPELIRVVRELATAKNIPITVDPKRRNFSEYKGITLFKPNLKELCEGLGMTIDKTDQAAIQEAAGLIHQRQGIEIIMVTLSEVGVYISRKSHDSAESYLIPAHLRSIADVSGAGDTVISVAALCLALDLPIYNIAAISNLAGGQVCEHVGVVPVDREKLRSELLSSGI